MIWRFFAERLSEERETTDYRHTDREDYRGVQGDQQLAATEELLGIVLVRLLNSKKKKRMR